MRFSLLGSGSSGNVAYVESGETRVLVDAGLSKPEVEKRLNADPSYKEQFAKAWGPGPITYEMVEKSIATFERTVVSGNSPFDRWKYGHDEKAMTESAKRGFVIFSSKNKGNCTACHARKEKRVTGFGKGSHPEFSTVAMTDSRPLKLNHAIHMRLKTPTFTSTGSVTAVRTR